MNDVTSNDVQRFVLSANLSVRATNVLLRNCVSIDEINLLNEETLSNFSNCGKKTINEIVHFLQTIRQERIIQPSPSAKEKLSRPPDESSLDLLPIFSSKKLDDVSFDDFHQDFKATTLLSDLVLSVRTRNVLTTLGMQTIGEVMLTSETSLLKQKNFGRKSLNELKSIIKNLIFNNALISPRRSDDAHDNDAAHIDYTSYGNMVLSLVLLCEKNKRNQELIKSRLCFYTDKAPTLEELGRRFKITRERVRQILKRGNARLQVKTILNKLSIFWERLEQLVISGGGVITVSDLSACLQDEFNWPEPPHPPALGQLLCLMKPELSPVSSKDLVAIDCECLSCELPLEQLLALDFEKHESFHFQVIIKRFVENCQSHCPASPVNSFHRAFIEKVVAQAKGSLVIHDDLIMTRDRWIIRYSTKLENIVVYVLEKNGRPMHFSEIARDVRKENLKFSEASDHNIHSALQRYDAIEIVKRGIYGLRAWGMGGYRSVSRAIEELLDEKDMPLRRQEILQLLEGEFSEQNISAALSNWDTRFVNIGEGFYDRLKNWQKRSCHNFIARLPSPVADLALYLVSRNNSSYKLVMALIFIRSMDKNGSLNLNKLKEMFYNSYLSRYKKGMVVETDEAVVSRIDKLEPDEIKNRACKEPLKSFLLSGYFFQFLQNGSKLCLREDIVGELADNSLRKLMMITLLKGIDEYFTRLAPTTTYQKHTGKRTVKVPESPLDFAHNTAKGDKDDTDNKAPSITIKKKAKGRIQL